MAKKEFITKQGYQIRLNDAITTIAAISRNTGKIDVHPRFFELEQMEQEFVLEHLFYYTKNIEPGIGTSRILADKYAMEKMVERYPDVSLKYWKKALVKIFKLGPGTTPEDLVRLDNL